MWLYTVFMLPECATKLVLGHTCIQHIYTHMHAVQIVIFNVCRGLVGGQQLSLGSRSLSALCNTGCLETRFPVYLSPCDGLKWPHERLLGPNGQAVFTRMPNSSASAYGVYIQPISLVVYACGAVLYLELQQGSLEFVAIHFLSCISRSFSL